MGTYPADLNCRVAGYDQDNRSKCMKAPPADRSIVSENDINNPGRSRQLFDKTSVVLPS